MAASDQASSARVLARARRAGLVVRTADLAALCGLLALLGWLHTWGTRGWSGLAEAARAGLSAAADPAAARVALAELAQPLLLSVGALVGLLWLASLLSLVLQTAAAGRAQPGSRRGRASGPGLDLLSLFSWSESQRVQGLWWGVKAALVALVGLGLVGEALPALAGLPETSPDEVGRVFRELCFAWLGRLALVAVPIVVLDVVVQRIRLRLAMSASAAHERQLRRMEEGDPHVRAQLRARLGREARNHRGTTGGHLAKRPQRSP
ncbi:MAG: EscU/YscU/HrcU family type III secretion system export apparatus switch protein [Myxococcales bacterium]|nr:EscU/YscU/HrcU family type III secretion system export apparatus switch protein [Myxococcales bacterium]